MRQKYITNSGSWAFVKNILKTLIPAHASKIYYKVWFLGMRQKYIKNSDSCTRVKNILQSLVPGQWACVKNILKTLVPAHASKIY